jgi:Hemopexin
VGTKVYFFKEDRYVRYDRSADRVDPDYVEERFDVFDGRDLWLPAAERVPATKPGGHYLPMPWRGVLHTVEGEVPPTMDIALNTFRTSGAWPTLTIEPSTLRIVQHYPLNTSARALGTRIVAETNRARCVQIEIVARGNDAPSWTADQLAFISGVMRQVEDLVPIPHVSGRTFLDHAGVDHTPANRMTVDQWRRYSGWCGHQHVPGQDHWDPGAVDIDTLML